MKRHCRECGGEVIIKKIIKGSIRTPRVDRVTCTVCGFEESVESDYLESLKDRQEIEIRDKIQEEKNKLKTESKDGDS